MTRRWIKAGIDTMVETIKRIVDGEIWAGHVLCHSCGHHWVAAAPWHTKDFECPKCNIMSGHPALNPGKEMVDRIVTALVDVGGIAAEDALRLLNDFVTQRLSRYLVYGVADEAIEAIDEIRKSQGQVEKE